MYEKMNKPIRLSPKLMIKVFNYLDLSDVIENCRLVCRRWNEIINEIRFDKLILNFNKMSINNWYGDRSEPIDLKELIFCNLKLIKESSAFKTNFMNLKMLKMNLNMEYFEIEQLNYFISLEHLELNSLLVLYEDKTLILPMVKVLYLDILGNQLNVNTPELARLHCNVLARIRLAHLEKIEFIEFQSNDNKNFDEDLSKFENLKVLRLNNVNGFDKNILYKLPANLKQLHFNDHQNIINRFDDYNHLFIYIMKERLDLDIYLNGIKLSESIDFSLDDLKLHYEYYEQLSKLTWFKELDYNKLMHIYKDAIPFNYFIKFNNIQVIRSSKIEHQKNFIQFVSNCHNLSVLFLVYPNLNQYFYDQLGNSNFLLTKFSLFEDTDIYLNYQFILKFKLLTQFSTTQHLSLNFTLETIKNQKLIERVQFKNRFHKVTILKLDTNKFYLDYGIKSYVANDYNQLEQIFKEQDSN